MDTITLKAQVGGLSVEVTGNPETAEKKFDELVKKYLTSGISGANGDQAGGVKATNDVKGKQISASEFLKKAAPKSQTERALILGYYLEKHESKENFTTSELAEVCQKARQTAFTNVSDSVGKLVSQGFLMGAGERDAKRVYVLTTSGEEEVANLLKSRPQ